MYMVVSFLGVQFKSKHFRENKEERSFCKNFDLGFLLSEFFERSKPETCRHNFLSAAYFSVRSIEKRCQLVLLQEKNMSLLSTKWVKLTPKISHFFGSGTWTIYLFLNVCEKHKFYCP